jgi:hypothetical protein
MANWQPYADFVAGEVTSVQVSDAPAYTVKKTKFTTFRSNGKEQDDDGFIVEGTGVQTHSLSAWEIRSKTAPNVTVQYVPHSNMKSGSDTTNGGRLQFKVEDFKGTEAEVQAALDIVREMGVDLTEPDETGMELTFWRQMHGLLGARSTSLAKDKKAKTDIDAAYAANPTMTVSEELAMLKEHFTTSMGKDVVEKADWKPRFARGRLDRNGYEGEETGRPYWMRADFDVEQARKDMNGALHGRTFWNSDSPSLPEDSALRPFKNGGFLANEERFHFTGWFGKGGGGDAAISGSSTGSQDRHYHGGGGSYYLFLRPSMNYHSNAQYFEPEVGGRINTFMASGDAYGGKQYRQTSSYDLSKMLKNGGTEIDVKYFMSVWDDLAFTVVNEATKKKMLEYFATKGMPADTDIRGISLSDRIVTTNAQFDAMKKRVWDLAVARQQEQMKGNQ